MSPPRKEQVIRTIVELLQDRNLLKRCVVQSFERACGDDGDHLDSQSLQRFRMLLGWILNMPNDALGDIESNLSFFDCDGSGSLDLNETYRLVKFHLREYYKALGGETRFPEMTQKTLAQAGYTVVRELGRGNQGVVKLARAQDGQEVCVKCLEKKSTMTGALEELQEEFQALQELSCDRIARVFEVFMDDSCYYMVGEPYHGGDMLTLKARAKSMGVLISEQWFRDLFWQCFEAVEFMHSLAVIHCDIKEPNIMLKTMDFHAPEIVLIDFGLSRAMAGKQNDCGGTPGYIPPETINTRRWFPRGDVFSMGVTLMQVACDKSPPQGARTIETPGGIFIEGCRAIRDIWKATKERQPPFHLLPPGMLGMARLLDATLQKQMGQRATAAQVLKQAWFREGRPTPKAQRPRQDTYITTQMLKEFHSEEQDPDASETVDNDNEVETSTTSPTSLATDASPSGSWATRHQQLQHEVRCNSPHFGALRQPHQLSGDCGPLVQHLGDESPCTPQVLGSGLVRPPIVQVGTFGRVAAPTSPSPSPAAAAAAVRALSRGLARSPSLQRSLSPRVSTVTRTQAAPTALLAQGQRSPARVMVQTARPEAQAAWSPRPAYSAMATPSPLIRREVPTLSPPRPSRAYTETSAMSPVGGVQAPGRAQAFTEGCCGRGGEKLAAGVPLLPPPCVAAAFLERQELHLADPRGLRPLSPTRISYSFGAAARMAQ